MWFPSSIFSRYIETELYWTRINKYNYKYLFIPKDINYFVGHDINKSVVEHIGQVYNSKDVIKEYYDKNEIPKIDNLYFMDIGATGGLGYDKLKTNNEQLYYLINVSKGFNPTFIKLLILLKDFKLNIEELNLNSEETNYLKQCLIEYPNLQTNIYWNVDELYYNLFNKIDDILKNKLDNISNDQNFNISMFGIVTNKKINFSNIYII